ncbi:MAG: hypothetical protein M3464_04280 [Chloroflexota bacterium]|nr:hypothetical protein [Chloroflexota bacterium]
MQDVHPRGVPSTANPSETNRTSLQPVLLLDAIGSGGGAVFLLTATGWLSPHLGLSTSLLRGAAVILIPFVVVLLVAVLAGATSRPLIGVIVAFNVVWVVASIGLLLFGRVSPTALGVAVVLAQAAAVAVVAWFQYAAIHRE